LALDPSIPAHLWPAQLALQIHAHLLVGFYPPILPMLNPPMSPILLFE